MLLTNDSLRDTTSGFYQVKNVISPNELKKSLNENEILFTETTSGLDIFYDKGIEIDGKNYPLWDNHDKRTHAKRNNGYRQVVFVCIEKSIPELEKEYENIFGKPYAYDKEDEYELHEFLVNVSCELSYIQADQDKLNTGVYGVKDIYYPISNDIEIL